MDLNTLCWLETTLHFRTDGEGLDALLRLQVIPIRDFFFNLNENKKNIYFTRSMPRIAQVNECDKFSKALKPSQMFQFKPLFYPAVMMFEEVHIPLTV